MTTNKILIFIIVSLLIACAFGFYIDANANGVDVTDCYAKVFVVTAIENDMVMLMDFNGDEWCYEGAEDWEVNDIACAIMYNNKTNLIYDDEIISLTYNGFIKEL